MMGGLREARKQATRAALRTHALRLFAQRGFRGTTVREIAAAAKVSPRTFFLHFTSKEEVLLGKVDERLAQLRAALRDSPAGEPLERIARAFMTLAADLERSDDLPLQLQLLRTVPSMVGAHYERFRAFEDTLAQTVQGWLAEAARTAGLPAAQEHDARVDAVGAYEAVTPEQMARLIAAVSLATARASVFAWYDEHVRPARGDEPTAGHAGAVAPGTLPRMVDASFRAVRHGLITRSEAGAVARWPSGGFRPPGGYGEPVTTGQPAPQG